MNKRTCDGIKALEYFGFKPKMAGWKSKWKHIHIKLLTPHMTVPSSAHDSSFIRLIEYFQTSQVMNAFLSEVAGVILLVVITNQE